MEQEIANLESIAAAEAAVEAQKNSWGTWLLSPIYKKVEDTGEERERKDRGRQERKIGKDLKERKLGLRKADLTKEETLLRNAKEKVDSANLVDTGKITAIEDRIRAREERERQERERIERERRARVWKQEQEQREKEAQEAMMAWKKQRAEEQAAEQKRQEEQARRLQKIFDEETKAYCYHDGWWPKVQGRTACPRCSEIWSYLLQCPTCTMKACPRCQSELRPRYSRHTARRAPLRASSPDFTPHYHYEDY